MSAFPERVPNDHRAGDGSAAAHCFLYEFGELLFVGGRKFFQREGDRPHRAVAEFRAVLEAEGRVPRFELVRAL